MPDLISDNFKTMLQSVDTFIFDLDHTLYDAEDVFKKMHLRMSGYVASLLDISYDEADKIRNQFYQQYGTTLHGLMNEHNINPHDYLDYVHDLDVSIVEKFKVYRDVSLSIQMHRLNMPTTFYNILRCPTCSRLFLTSRQPTLFASLTNHLTKSLSNAMTLPPKTALCLKIQRKI